MAKVGRKSQRDLLMKRLKSQAIITVKDAAKLGISNLQLHRLASEEKLTRLGAGLYYNPASSLHGTDLDYAIACQRLGPESAIGGLSALFHYQLSEEVPQQIWVMVDTSARPRIKTYRAIRTSIPMNIEVESRKYYRIVSIERALLEALRYASKMGLDTALTAIRKALRQNLTTMNKLGAAATKLKLKKYLVKHWEAIIS